MFPKQLNRFATKIIGKASLQTVLVVPFLVQINETIPLEVSGTPIYGS